MVFYRAISVARAPKCCHAPIGPSISVDFNFIIKCRLEMEQYVVYTSDDSFNLIGVRVLHTSKDPFRALID